MLGVNRVNLDASARNHQPCRPERLGQDDADEPDDRTGAAIARDRSRVLGMKPDERERVLPQRWLLRAVRFVSARRLRVTNSSTSLMLCTASIRRAHGLSWPRGPRARRHDDAAAHRKIAGYSKGMRQRIRLAQAIAHHPRVLVLDEPLNGLDPMARAETMALFQELGRQGMHVDHLQPHSR